MIKKQILSIFLAIFLISCFTNIAVAQTKSSNQNLKKTGNARASLKFIEGVQLVPETSAEKQVVSIDIKEIKPAILENSIHIENIYTDNIEKCSALQFKYAMMTNMEVENLTNIPLYSLIDDWWATRYHYGGSDRTGIDCSAFTGKILSSIYGISAPRTSGDQYAMAEKISQQNLKEGDLVFFANRSSVSHVGLYLGNNYFVHSSVASGVTINSLTDDYYSRKFIGGGRIGKN